MMIIAAVFACSAASVASAGSMHEEAMRSANDPNTGNAIHIPISGLNADMETSYHDNNNEERTGFVPAEAEVMLGELHAFMVKSFPKNTRPAMIAALTPRITNMNEAFTRLILATKNGKIFEGPFILDWEHDVMSVYWDFSDIAHRAMFVMLANRFKGDDLASVLIAGTKIDDTKGIAEKLLDVQVTEWVKSEREPADIFKLFLLHETNDNPIESPLFTKWVNFVKLKHRKPPEAAFQAMLSVLFDHFEGDDALASALLAGTKTSGSKDIARELLDHQIKMWAGGRIRLQRVFELLDLEHTEDKLFESPFFSDWVKFCNGGTPAGCFHGNQGHSVIPIAYRLCV